MTRSKKPYLYKDSALEEDRKEAEKVEAWIESRKKSNKKKSTNDFISPVQEEEEVKDGKDNDESNKKNKSARLLQEHYRAHQATRSSKGMNLSNSVRWTDGLKERSLREAGKNQNEGYKNDSISRWKRAGMYTKAISGSNSNRPGDLSEGEEMERFAKNDIERNKIKEERKVSKDIEHQYFLEMCDEAHRYGSNLKWYHTKWNEDDTSLNFFEWLDNGPGKTLDLEQCPRTRLDNEKITYLNAEQRLNYLVIPDPSSGLLTWAKNGKLLNTTKYHRDAGPDIGIIEMSEEEFKEQEEKDKLKKKEVRDEGKDQVDDLSDGCGSSNSSISESDEEEEGREGVQGYSDKGGTAGAGKGIDQMKARLHYYLSPRAVMDRMLRETINKNTWLFVCDLNHNLYVGLKKTGNFQHSSFLYGGRVLTAGLLQADKGKLTSLSPLSGHYRAGTQHFKAFVQSLEARGVDMSSVNISKSLTVIGAIEKYASISKKKKSLADKIKTTLHLGLSTSQKKELKDLKDREKIIALEKGDSNRDPSGKKIKEESSKGEDEEEEGGFRTPLPGDGEDPSSWSEEKRLKRGIALVQRAVERGIREQQKHWGEVKLEGEEEEGCEEKKD